MKVMPSSVSISSTCETREQVELSLNRVHRPCVVTPVVGSVNIRCLPAADIYAVDLATWAACIISNSWVGRSDELVVADLATKPGHVAEAAEGLGPNQLDGQLSGGLHGLEA
mmetsp:Transcript_28892/g.63693  ORF Transcript_28892/g.63693 Transcript_28892/m.63693 type:complete len:112 (+) Transcript_28892:830-1165(+)